MQKTAFLSGNMLKLIAAAAMLVDHIGAMFFPGVRILRIIGRLALPIFAFMISESCKYTRNRLRYFLTVAGMATLFQVVYFVATGDTKMSIFVTFSLSILMIYALDYLKESLWAENSSIIRKIVAPLLFLGSIVAVFFINENFTLDYNFAGCMLPVFTSIFHATKSTPEALRRLDNKYMKILALSIGLVWLVIIGSRNQVFALLTIPLLLLYSGKRGKLNIKYFFYVFYPAHLVILYAIAILIK